MGWGVFDVISCRQSRTESGKQQDSKPPMVNIKVIDRRLLKSALLTQIVL